MATVCESVSRLNGGLFHSVRRLTQELTARHIGVEVLGLRDRYADEDGVAWQPVPVKTYATAGPRAYGFAPRLAPDLVHGSFDLLHQHGLWVYPSLASSRWHTRTGRPYLVSPRGMLDPWAVRNSRWKKQLVSFFQENRFLRQAACFHALCTSEAESIRAYGLTDTPIAVIPNGADLPAPGMEQVPPPWSDEIPNDACVALFLSRLHPKKGLENLLRAFADVIAGQNDRPWHLVVAGWDEIGHEPRLQALAAELEVTARVHFVGPLFAERKAAAFRTADAFVLPSFSEGLPMAVLEAWAYGLPVIMTDACNLPEGFAADAAIRVETNPASIAAGLRQAHAMDDSARRAMGARGRTLVATQFSWQGIAERMQSVYDWLIDGGPRPEHITWM